MDFRRDRPAARRLLLCLAACVAEARAYREALDQRVLDDLLVVVVDELEAHRSGVGGEGKEENESAQQAGRRARSGRRRCRNGVHRRRYRMRCLLRMKVTRRLRRLGRSGENGRRDE